MDEIVLRPPRELDGPAFVAAVRASRELHASWVVPPRDIDGFLDLLLRSRRRDHVTYLAWSGPDLVGLVSLNDIVRSNLSSASLGYYGFVPFDGRGWMREALTGTITRAFTAHDLHRLEANIQPGNTRSRSLVSRLGFRLEGFSPRFLRVRGQWRDHERWALLADEWHGTRGPSPGLRSPE